MTQHDKPVNPRVTVRPVMSYRDMGKFIEVPWHVYANDPMWVPPLRLERCFHFSRFNPYFKHGEWQAWVAFQNGQPVGRISAQIDSLHQERYGADSGHFGLLECIDDAEVFATLLLHAEAWLASREIRRVSGPFNLSINQECGILVDGFDTPPVVMMPHSPRWYSRLLESQGYLPQKDLLAYKVKVDFEIPRVMQAVINRCSPQIKLRTLQRDRFDQEMETLRDIFNDAWSENWGFIPFTQEEFAELGSSLRLLLPDEYIQIAEVNGEPAAFMVGLPNLNEVLIELNGSLFPFGWLKLINKVRNHEIHTGRIPLMGVRKKYHHSPIGLALACLVIDAPRQAGMKRGIKEVEMSWILEDNMAMRGILDSIGSEQYKRYRIYGKTL
ncbi:N-acetyltransferase [Nitrosomonas oligotropha]|uniref:N-acetyltransferase n=1 Tax=Nitrosomonas oligotropha TaxID=42354 RepID=UPI00136CBCF0|nr:N-acetyltransferase [Nitrosomonas oligotropha]MXS82879.1 N-acetyltransferase [Nitrosomonas oligotropha]